MKALFENDLAPLRLHGEEGLERKRVEMIGGKFRVESASGKGATVTVKIPQLS